MAVQRKYACINLYAPALYSTNTTTESSMVVGEPWINTISVNFDYRPDQLSEIWDEIGAESWFDFYSNEPSCSLTVDYLYLQYVYAKTGCLLEKWNEKGCHLLATNLPIIHAPLSKKNCLALPVLSKGALPDLSSSPHMGTIHCTKMSHMRQLNSVGSWIDVGTFYYNFTQD